MKHSKTSCAFWLERGVGGFRFDAITTLFEDPSLRRRRRGDTTRTATRSSMLIGDPQLDGSKTDNQPGVHEVVAEDARDG